jgi:hypothetical protein
MLRPMPDLNQCAEFILHELLPEVLAEGQPPRLPPAAPGRRTLPRITDDLGHLNVRILAGPRPSASIVLETGTINFTYGWFCERWCSTYLLLRAMAVVPAIDEPLITVRPAGDIYHWPDNIPVPWAKGDALVAYANKVLKWVVLPTLLHEVGHAVERESGKSGEALEMACDAIAIWHLLGRRQDEYRDIITLGVVIWLCCLCSEARAARRAPEDQHPCPVDRVRAYLREFVPPNAEFGSRVWLLGVSHVLRLTAGRNRAGLDEVLTHTHGSLDELLADLRKCWP